MCKAWPESLRIMAVEGHLDRALHEYNSWMLNGIGI